jgi:hypothetical protein
MATSISDLLTTLDGHTRSQFIDPVDAARALHHVVRVLDAVRSDGLGRDYPPDCITVIRRLGESCADVAAGFDDPRQEPGDISNLAGVLGDAVGTLNRELV